MEKLIVVAIIKLCIYIAVTHFIYQDEGDKIENVQLTILKLFRRFIIPLAILEEVISHIGTGM